MCQILDTINNKQSDYQLPKYSNYFSYIKYFHNFIRYKTCRFNVRVYII